MTDLREAEPRDIQEAISRALVCAKAVRAQGPHPDGHALHVDPRRLSVVITKLEEAEMWLGEDRTALREAVGLLDSMVRSGEKHTEVSEAVVARARTALR